MAPNQSTNEPELRLGDRFGWIVGIGFFCLAAWFLFSGQVIDQPLTEPVLVEASVLPPMKWRESTPNPPVTIIAGFKQTCTSCHNLFDSKALIPRVLRQHTDLKLAHGGNEWCFNCHDKENRNRLALNGGETVDFDHVQQLCGKCHGPTYRDWQVGIHGKTLGYWNQEMGERVRLTCTECHDPHSPAFKQMKLFPGPNTLRMGDGDANIIRHDHKHNPLRQWQEHDAVPETDSNQDTTEEHGSEH